MSNSISASSFSSSISSCAAVLLSRVQRQMMEEPQHASSLIGNEGLELAPELHGAMRHAAALNALRLAQLRRLNSPRKFSLFHQHRAENE